MPERGTNREWHLTPRRPRTLSTQRPTLTLLVLTRSVHGCELRIYELVKPRKSTTSALTTLSRLRHTWHADAASTHTTRRPTNRSVNAGEARLAIAVLDQCFSRVDAPSLTRQKEAQAASVRLTACGVTVLSVNMPLCRQRGEPEPGDRSRED